MSAVGLQQTFALVSLAEGGNLPERLRFHGIVFRKRLPKRAAELRGKLTETVMMTYLDNTRKVHSVNTIGHYLAERKENKS